MNNKNLIEYKQYHGSACFDPKQEIFYGKIEFIRDLVTYEASDAKSLVQSFRNAVDDYLEDCITLNKVADKPFKGSFNIRVSPSLHKEISLYAIQHDSTVNNIVKSALKSFIEHKSI